LARRAHASGRAFAEVLPPAGVAARARPRGARARARLRARLSGQALTLTGAGAGRAPHARLGAGRGLRPAAAAARRLGRARRAGALAGARRAPTPIARVGARADLRAALAARDGRGRARRADRSRLTLAVLPRAPPAARLARPRPLLRSAGVACLAPGLHRAGCALAESGISAGVGAHLAPLVDAFGARRALPVALARASVDAHRGVEALAQVVDAERAARAVRGGQALEPVRLRAAEREDHERQGKQARHGA